MGKSATCCSRVIRRRSDQSGSGTPGSKKSHESLGCLVASPTDYSDYSSLSVCARSLGCEEKSQRATNQQISTRRPQRMTPRTGAPFADKMQEHCAPTPWVPFAPLWYAGSFVQSQPADCKCNMLSNWCSESSKAGNAQRN